MVYRWRFFLSWTVATTLWCLFIIFKFIGDYMTDEEIEQTFQDAWDEFGDDASTEFLIGITADRCGCDYGDVVDALANIHSKNKETDDD